METAQNKKSIMNYMVYRFQASLISGFFFFFFWIYNLYMKSTGKERKKEKEEEKPRARAVASVFFIHPLLQLAPVAPEKNVFEHSL